MVRQNRPQRRLKTVRECGDTIASQLLPPKKAVIPAIVV